MSTPTWMLYYCKSDGRAWVFEVVEGQVERRPHDLPQPRYSTLPAAATAARASGLPVTHWHHGEVQYFAPMSLEGVGR